MSRPPPVHRTPMHVINAAATARHQQTHMIAIQNALARARQIAALPRSMPSIVLQAVVVPGDQTSDGQIVLAAAYPWFKIVDLLHRDPNAVYQLDWRKWEEMIAGAYAEQGFDVVLTPRSNDKGRDVIASSRGVGSIRYFDQVKAFRHDHLVTANDVRAMVGVLALEGNVSKGIITTTSDFAPGVMADENILRLMPYRLELKPRDALLDWLGAIASGETKKRSSDKE